MACNDGAACCSATRRITMAIITEYVAPPVPSTMYDWLAYVDGQEEEGPHGRGPSEVEAVKDLCEQLHDMVRMSLPG